MTFHEDLVAARRRGETLPEPGTPQPAPSLTAPPDVPVSYRPPSVGAPMVCVRCGALVDIEAVATHADWHRLNVA